MITREPGVALSHLTLALLNEATVLLVDIPLPEEPTLVRRFVDLRRLILEDRLDWVLFPDSLMTLDIASPIPTEMCLTLHRLLPCTVGLSSEMGLSSMPSLMKRILGL
jgi:hypothetical protein